jgi:uncharacterized protein (DUF433 family)
MTSHDAPALDAFVSNLFGGLGEPMGSSSAADDTPARRPRRELGSRTSRRQRVDGGTIRDTREEDEFLAAVARELAPRTRLEGVAAETLGRAAWRLQQALRKGLQEGETRAAQRAWRRAMSDWAMLRSWQSTSWGVRPSMASVPVSTVVDRDEPPAVERKGESPTAATVDDDRWRDRLTFDVSVSETSPVVKGTQVTAGQIVSMIVDGATWADILRMRPELTEEDIQACLAFTVEQDELPLVL